MKNILKVGTDCSGIEAPIQALEQLQIPHEHVWSSEIDKFCIKSIKPNYAPGRLYGDIRNRNNDELPDVDLYVCGFPCQSFSQAGSRRGLSDPRGNIFYNCLETIKAKKPRYFILENVKNILFIDKKDKKQKYGEAWKVIWNELGKLKTLGYSVDWKVLNTRNYGIPQNRERLYIVGTMDGKYSWPTMCKMNIIEQYIDNKDAVKSITRSDRARLQNGRSINKDAVFIDLGFVKYSAYPSADQYAPCITARTELYSFRKNRYANVKEYLMLQGFPTSFKQVVSDTQMKKQIGNSMSVNVLKQLISNLI